MRNAEAHRDEAQQVEVTSSLPHPAPDEALHIVTGTAVERGRRYFQATCAAATASLEKSASAPLSMASRSGTCSGFSAQEMRGSEYMSSALARYVRARADGTLSGLLIGRDANGRRVGRRCLSPALQGSRSSGREAVRPARDDVGDLLKLVRCEVGRDLVNRSGFGYQKHGCRDRG